MSCDKCDSSRILSINAKCSDLFSMVYKGKEYDGYVPTNLAFGQQGYGDYVEMDICMECGKVQGKYPVKEAVIVGNFKDVEETVE